MGKITRDFPDLKGSGKLDRITIFDSLSDFADSAQALSQNGHYDDAGHWFGGVPLNTTAKYCRTGDLARVEPSDKLLSAFENKFHFQSSAFQTVDAVAGGVPNVPAFLAGQPLAMRRRQRVTNEQAPLNILIDLTSSGGITSAQLEKRGAALLALVRILSAQRPVNLYAASSGLPRSAGERFMSSAVLFRLDTAPLDLARAAHVLCATGVARQLGYSTLTEQVGSKGGDIAWPYNSDEYTRRNGVAYWQRAIGTDELLYLAPAFAYDENLTNPEKWLTDMLAKYGPL
jgi:hypothetical protein